jgi:O-antigen/teichoic acid export membrane protein
VDSLARSGSLVLAGFVCTAALQFALVLIITHGLPVGTAGALFEAIALVTMAGNAVLLGADSGLIRWLPELRARGRTDELRRALVIAVVPVAVIGTVVSLALSLSAPELAHLLVGEAQRSVATHFIRIMAWGIALAAVTTVMLAGTRALGTLVPFVAVQQLLIPGLRPVLVGIAVAVSGSAVLVAAGWLLPVVVGCALAVVALASRLGRAERDALPGRGERARPQRRLARDFWRFAAPTTFATVFVEAVSSLDVLLVGALGSARAAAIYAAASRVILVGVYVVEAMGKALGPRLSDALAHRNVAGANALYHVSASWMMVLLWPLYAMLALFAPVVMRVFGHGYDAGAKALTILAFAELVDVSTGNMTLLLLMAGRSGLNLGNAAFAFALNLGLNIALIPRFGMSGAAVAWASSIVAVNLAAVVETRILVGVRPLGSGARVAVLSTAVAYGIVGGLVRWRMGSSVPAFVVAALGGTGLYAIFVSMARETLHLPELVRALSRRDVPSPERTVALPERQLP